MEKEIAEQQEVNEQLLTELEKRDQAVEEAVGIIVDLEDKVEGLMQDIEAVKAFDGSKESAYFRESHETSNPPSEKPRLKVYTRAIARMPSFLSEQSEGAEALRNLYLPRNRSHSDATMRKLSEETNTDIPDSPRLSVLSESSFISVYGEKQLLPASERTEIDAETAPRTHRKSLSIEKWIEGRPAHDATPSKLYRGDGIRKNGFLSITDVLESPLQRLEQLRHTLEKHNTGLGRIPERPRSINKGRRLRAEGKGKPTQLVHREFTDKSSFEHYQTLPPTPDTISTSTLNHHQNSNEDLDQRVDANNRIILATKFTVPILKDSYKSHEVHHSLRPHSAGETVTSRREGHGWDTQDDLTETASLSSTASASASAVHPQAKATMLPNIFTVSNLNSRDERGGWGTDMMFNNEPNLPVHTASRYNWLRCSSLVENSRPQDADIAQNRMQQYNGERSPPQNSISPIDISPRPNLPDRRSSLSATIKVRKTNANHSMNDFAHVTTISPITKNTFTEAKKSRLGMPRLFTRSDTTPPEAFFQHPKDNESQSLSSLDGSYRECCEEEDMARATPPPIKRNRGAAITAYRPSSSGEGALRDRRRNVFGYDGPGDEMNVKSGTIDLGAAKKSEDEELSTGAKNAGGQRKWLGFGRTASLRRT